MPRRAITVPSDRGRTSLAGFMYQVVGIQGLIALAYSAAIENDQEYEAFLKLLPNPTGVHEVDEDAVVQWITPTGTSGSTYLQFKYSSVDQPESIDRTDLCKILDHLPADTSSTDGKSTATVKYALVTNRPLSGPLENCLEEHTKKLYAWRTGCDHKDKPLGVERLEKLKRLRFVFASMEDWQQKLRGLAREYGLLPDEIETGINALCGRLALDTVATADPPRVTRESLLSIFCGSDRAQRLVPRCAWQSTIAALDGFRAVRVPLKGHVVRRDKDDELWELARNYPVVAVTGPGGSGKTVALWNWAAAQAPAEDGSGRFVGIKFAPEVPEYWVYQLVWKWRGLSHVDDPKGRDHERAMKRLLIANPERGRPILLLAIDGLDADIDEEALGRIRILVKWLVQSHPQVTGNHEPPCTLVLTCRTEEELRRKLGSGGGFGSPEFPRIEVVDFGDFEPKQLAGGALDEETRVVLGERVAGRLSDALLEYSLANPALLSSPAVLLASAGASGPARDIPSYVLDALLHPLIWRAFLDLPSADVRMAVLDGDPWGLRQLAEITVSRFDFQTKERLDLKAHPSGLIRHALADVAHWMSDNSRAIISRTDWREAMKDHMSGSLARKLLGEAETGGIIIQSSDGCSWRHAFVADYLLSV